MISGMGSNSGGTSPEKKDALVKIILTALLSAISVICGINIGVIA